MKIAPSLKPIAVRTKVLPPRPKLKPTIVLANDAAPKLIGEYKLCNKPNKKPNAEP